MAVELTPITDVDVSKVAEFLHVNLNQRVSPSVWCQVMSPPWKADAPNHGFMLQDRHRVVGVYLAFYSERVIAGRDERFCNLASWAVMPDYRFHSVRLLNALLSQDGYHFTDLAPSHKVQAVNRRFKFQNLDTTAVVVPNLPWPTLPGRMKISADPDLIASALTGHELELYLDHAQALAARHLVLSYDGEEPCYVMFRERWWRDRPFFAAILHVSNPGLFRRAAVPLARYFLVRHRLPVTLAELRIVGSRPGISVRLPYPETVIRSHSSRIAQSYAARYQGTIPGKMYRSASLEPSQIDDLYSELVSVPSW